jgi:P4 family phage/plasmid primase-like protien
MSFNKYLNNRTLTTADEMVNFKVSDMQNRNSEDYYFNKKDIDIMPHYSYIEERYKLCDKIYYYFNQSSKLWCEQATDDIFITKICEYSCTILEGEERHVKLLLNDKKNELEKKVLLDKATSSEKEEYIEIKKCIEEFIKFIEKTKKDRAKAKFTKSVINFFHAKIIDTEFKNKININNHHLLPLKYSNLNLITLKEEERTKEQYFTKCLDIVDIKGLHTESEEYKIVDDFFNDISTGHKPKKEYLQKTLGYFLTGAVPLGRTFHIFYGDGCNGKSAFIDILCGVMRHYIKSVESSIIIKTGKKNAGNASPELEVLDYGLRLAILSETDEGDKLNESLIKNISGYDFIDYRPLYGKNKNIQTEAKLCMLTNNKPYFKLSQSMVDRIRFMSFNSRFINEEEFNNKTKNKTIKNNEYKRDCDLVNDLKTVYRDYVLYWLVLGSKKFFEDKHMNIPDDKLLQTENLSYINEMDSYKRFVDECLEINEKEKTSAHSVNDCYKKFCEDENIPPLKPSKFKSLLIKQFIQVKNSSNMYVGFKIRSQSEDLTN